MSSNHNNNRRNVSARASVSALASRLRHLDRSTAGSDAYVAVVRALVATRDPAAVPVLASLLDSTGPIAAESIAGLIAFGVAAIPAMRACTESLDYETIRHAHRVLAELGDDASRKWLRDDGADRIDTFLERVGFTDVECGEPVANEADDAKEIA